MQDFAVFVIVGCAAAYMGRSWWLTAQGKKGCGGCNACPSSAAAKKQAPAGPQLMQIDLNGSWKK
jgi:hypothetical protein